MNKLLEIAKEHLYDFHIQESKNIKRENVKLLASQELADRISHNFLVKDEFYDNCQVVITLKNNSLYSYGCSCRKFHITKSCNHIAAVINYYGEELTKVDPNMLKVISNNIIKNLKQNSKSNIKKLLNVEYEMNFYNDYSRFIELKVKIGTTKLYTMSSKASNFFRSYETGKGIVYFGKEFEYDPEVHYFSEEDEKIIDLLTKYIRNDGFIFYNYEIKKLLKLFRNKTFTFNHHLVEGIKEEIPFNIGLTKDNDEYTLKFDYNNSITVLTNDYNYIIYDNKIYHLNNNYAKLLSLLEDFNINSLVFNKQQFNDFSKGILPIIKNDLVIDSNIDEISVLNTSKVKLYFDLNQDNIRCKIKLNYNKKEIDYFDSDKDIVRDLNFEQEIIEDLNKYKFEIINKKIVLLNLDDIVEFLENGLDAFAEKYQVYTSEKLKSASIIKKTNVRSNFSIGSDNIMRYNFEIDDIDKNEIDNLINSIRKKQNYYRLKNGNIVSLKNDSLNELSDLVEDLNIDIKNPNGEIPKYQAIYLDYLKKEKYPYLETNNLFDNFITNFRKYQNINLTINDNILRDYQKDGVKWLYTIYKCDLGGILADEMGLGKTIQTIYLMKEIIKEDENSKFLIVCPTALVYNWEDELNKYGKNLSYKIIHGTNRNKNIDTIKENILITSYGTLREDIELYEKMNFKLMVIDEAQNIKNANAMITKSTKMIKARTKIALTGTPLENSIVELWSIFDFIMPGFLGTLNKFNDKYHFKDNDDSYNEKLLKLKQVTSPFIMRRKKSDVAKELPDKIENNIYIELGEKQKILYSNEVKNVKKEIDELLKVNDFNASKAQILTLLTRLRQLCVDPRLIYENYTGESIKIESLINILKEIIANKHKILIFTSFKSALEIVEKEFLKNDISYYKIDGSVSSKNRKILVDKFNNDTTNVFLITIKSGGTGLNLTSADVVIHLDLWWNPQVENQATDRAHRIGQTKNVEVIKLITKGTIEERILELQQKKQKLSDDLIEKGEIVNNELASLTEKDIKKLLDTND